MTCLEYEALRSSILNEISVDNYLIEKSCVVYDNKSIYKVIRFKNKIPFFLCYFILPSIPFVFLILSFVLFFKKIKNTFVKTKKLPHEFCLAFSTRQIDILKKHEKIVPIYLAGDLVKCNISVFDIFASYAIACYTVFFMARHIPIRYHFHLLHVFELLSFLRWLKSEEAGSNIMICSHYDRWATLLMNVKIGDVCVVQHGILDEKFFPSCKIPCPQKLVCFSKLDKNIFLNNIYIGLPKVVECITPELNINLNVRCDILIINNPLFLDVEMKIFNALSSDEFNLRPLKILFRPHPAAINKVSKLISKENLSIGEPFPCPKIFVCRESTLGTQYESNGYTAVWWNERDSLAEIMGRIKNCLG